MGTAPAVAIGDIVRGGLQAGIGFPAAARYHGWESSVIAPSLIADSTAFALLSAMTAGAFLAAIAWIAIERPALAMIYFLVFLAFVWRLDSVLYIDLFGPLFSEQLDRDVGPGISVVPLAISQGLMIAALLFSFRRSRLRALRGQAHSQLAALMSSGRFKLSDLAFWAFALFTIALWIELLVRGPIPLFAAMERFDYSRLYGGLLHHRLMEWGPMLAFQIGVFFATPTLHDRPFDWRFGAVFATLLLYLFLVGHRFSSFYVYGSFFIIPIGAVLLGRQARGLSARKVLAGTALRNLCLAGTALVVLVAAAVFYSYAVVRGFQGTELLAKLSQRILVQQGEMWWMTYERVFVQGNWDGDFAAYKLFVDPFDPTRNSTMQLLMELGLPLERAHFILGAGSAYTGGWPEVCFELGGPIGGFVLAALSAILFSEFMFLLTRCIAQERFATCFFLTPILFALAIGVVAGMVNSFIQVTFMVKAIAALVVYVAEDRWRSTPISVPCTTSPDPLPVPGKEA
jgi:hypothetical protein